MIELLSMARALWLVWLLVLFVAIVLWVMRPGRAAALRRAARMPLDDEPGPTPDRRSF